MGYIERVLQFDADHHYIENLVKQAAADDKVCWALAGALHCLPDPENKNRLAVRNWFSTYLSSQACAGDYLVGMFKILLATGEYGQDVIKTFIQSTDDLAKRVCPALEYEGDVLNALVKLGGVKEPLDKAFSAFW